jgi:hypothetical protein
LFPFFCVHLRPFPFHSVLSALSFDSASYISSPHPLVATTTAFDFNEPSPHPPATLVLVSPVLALFWSSALQNAESVVFLWRWRRREQRAKKRRK